MLSISPFSPRQQASYGTLSDARKTFESLGRQGDNKEEGGRVQKRLRGMSVEVVTEMYLSKARCAFLPVSLSLTFPKAYRQGWGTKSRESRVQGIGVFFWAPFSWLTFRQLGAFLSFLVLTLPQAPLTGPWHCRAGVTLTS